MVPRLIKLNYINYPFMKVKILLAAVVAGVFVLYLPACAKHNAVELGLRSCDTTNVSYSAQIVTILQDNCYVCHKGPGASSGIDFSNYAAFKGWAQSGLCGGGYHGRTRVYAYAIRTAACPPVISIPFWPGSTRDAK
jgi:hypothetical protein